MSKNNRSKTLYIKNPSDKVIGFFNKIQAEKAKKREMLLKKDEYTFKITM